MKNHMRYSINTTDYLERYHSILNEMIAQMSSVELTGSISADFIRKMQLLLNSEWEDFKTCYENNKYQALRSYVPDYPYSFYQHTHQKKYYGIKYAGCYYRN